MFCKSNYCGIIRQYMNPRLSRKKELAKRTLVYGLMVTSVLVLLTVLMMAVLGYQWDLKTRSVEQTGLVQFNSFPNSAVVSIDGRALSSRTQTKSTVAPGKIQFAMQLPGYESWQKTVDVKPGVITWLNYARLVPTKKNITTAYSVPTAEQIVASPDRRYMALWRFDSGVPVFGLIDFRNSQRPSAVDYTPVVEQMSGLDLNNPAQSHQMTSTTWSKDSRFMTVKHVYQFDNEAPKSEWLWIDRESPESMVNLTNLLGMDLNDVQPLDNRKVMVLAGQDMREASISDGSISRPLVSGASSFGVYDDDRLTYIAKDGDYTVAGLWLRGKEPTVIARSLTSDNQAINIATGRYFNKDTIAVSIDRQVTYYRGDIPTNKESLASLLKTGKSFTFNHAVESLQFSDNGRFLVAEDSKSLMSFDIERVEVSQNIVKYSPSPVSWLDGYHITQVDGSGLRIMQEFDGLNTAQLMPSSADYDSLLTNDGKYLYSWLSSDGVLELRRLSMTI